jgi:hypothetical protein
MATPSATGCEQAGKNYSHLLKFLCNDAATASAYRLKFSNG